jgi:hypothetical protein
MSSYAVRTPNLPALIEQWKRMADEAGEVPRFRVHQRLLDALGGAPTVQWFYYCDDREGISFKLYDWELIARHAAQRRELRGEDDYLIVQGERLGPEGPDTLKERFLETFAEHFLTNDERARHGGRNLANCTPEQRILYFTPRNRPNGPPPPPPPWPTPMDDLIDLCEEHPQIILYGPPGTGKTRTAQRLALALLEGLSAEEAEALPSDEVRNRLDVCSTQGRYGLVVFHPAYEYEQFVGGIVPETDRDGDERQGLDYKVEPGIFLALCNKVRSDQKSVLIIDEVRACYGLNASKMVAALWSISILKAT